MPGRKKGKGVAGGIEYKCASRSLHQTWSCSEDAHVEGTKRIRSNVRNKLIELCGYKGPIKSVHFCVDCINEVKTRYPELDDLSSKGVDHSYTRNKRTAKGREDNVQYIVTMLDSLNQSERAQVAFALAKLEYKGLMDDCFELASGRSLDDILNSLRLDNFVKNRNKVVVAFLCGLANADNPIARRTTATATPERPSTSGFEPRFEQAVNQQTMYRLCKTVESIMHYVNPKCIFPIHFHESTLLYTLVGSKIALQITSLGSPYASYQTVKRWLNSISGEPPGPIEGDIVAVFDNNQVLQRRWRVKLSNDFKVNIITMVVIFTLDSKGELLTQVQLKPSEWLALKGSTKIGKLDQTKEIMDTHAEHLNKYLAERLDKVLSQQRFADGKWTDTIDEIVESEGNRSAFKTCKECGLDDIAKTKRNCPGCAVNLKQAEFAALGIDQHGTYVEKTESVRAKGEMQVRVGEEGMRSERLLEDQREYAKYSKCLTTEKCPVTVAPPVFVNPCSYDSVTTVLVAIGRKTGVKQYGTGNREWAPVVCDGLPYGLARRVILCTYRCPHCLALVYGLENLEEHENEKHSSAEKVAAKKEFGWLLLIPGPGHVEMNMVKSFVELTWDIFWQDMVMLFNFKSPNALKSAKSANDHHKTWTLCRIAREALTDELLVPFVRAVLSTSNKETEISPSLFKKFILNAQNPNYAFMADCVFELLDSVFMYRTGVRSGNLAQIDAGRAKYAKVWFGRAHPLYRELEVSDSLMRERMPPELVELMTKTLSLNTSGVPYTAEGADFKLEAVNKNVQRLVPNIPSGHDWVTACATHDKLVLMRERLFEAAGTKDPSDRSAVRTPQDISKEVGAFRAVVRGACYLKDPLNGKLPHTSLNGKTLDPELRKFCATSRDIRSRYIDFLTNAEKDINLKEPKRAYFKEAIIPITSEERKQSNAISNRTVAQIKEGIKLSMSQIEDPDLQEEMQSAFERNVGKTARKTDLIAFYEELLAHIENEGTLEPPNELFDNEQDE